MAEVSLNTVYTAEPEKNVKKGLAQQTKTEPVSIYDVLKTAEGKTTKEVYKEVKEYYKDNDLNLAQEDTTKRSWFQRKILGMHDYKRPNWFQRNILGTRDVNIYRTKALENKQNDVLTTGAGEGDVRNKTYRRLTQAGFLKDADGHIDVERLAEMYNARAGADNYINYSHENSEFRQLRADLNAIGEQYGVTFSKKDTKEIIKLIGDKEKWYNPGQGIRRTVGVGGAGAAAGAAMKAELAQDIGDIMGQTLKVTAAIPVAATAAAVTLGADMLAQAFRNEKAVSVEVTHDNAEAYNKYLDESKASKDGIAVMKELATHYTDENGNLNKDAMNAAMRKAAGKDSVLNIDEAKGLLYKLNTEEKEEPKEMPELKAAGLPTPAASELEPAAKLEKQATPHYVIVQNGESLSKLAKKYGVTIQELMDLNGIKRFTDDCGEIKIQGFKVGQRIKLPAHANIEAAKNNKTAAEAIKDYENMWTAKIKKGEEPCEDDHKVSNVFLNNVRASLQK